ncbi:hypothetical protein KKH82_03590 [Patescibacteria group bacterium]|nr:hypothetical protein [Patescibacteria group bacterium]
MFSFAYAQESDPVTVSIPIDASSINDATADLGMIDVSFCEVPGEKEATYFMRA